MYVSVNIWFLCFVIAAVCCCILVCSVTGEISQRKRRRRAKNYRAKAALFKQLFEFSRRVQSAPWFCSFIPAQSGRIELKHHALRFTYNVLV